MCSFYIILLAYLVYLHLVLPRSTLFIHSLRFLRQIGIKIATWLWEMVMLSHPKCWFGPPNLRRIATKNRRSRHHCEASSRWWLNQPIWKYARQIGSCPQVGVNMKNIWNHYLVCLTSLPGIWLTKTSPIWSCWSFRANNSSDLLLETTNWTIWIRPCLAFIPDFTAHPRLSSHLPSDRCFRTGSSTPDNPQWDFA